MLGNPSPLPSRFPSTLGLRPWEISRVREISWASDPINIEKYSPILQTIHPKPREIINSLPKLRFLTFWKGLKSCTGKLKWFSWHISSFWEILKNLLCIFFRCGLILGLKTPDHWDNFELQKILTSFLLKHLWVYSFLRTFLTLITKVLENSKSCAIFFV